MMSKYVGWPVKPWSTWRTQNQPLIVLHPRCSTYDPHTRFGVRRWDPPRDILIYTLFQRATSWHREAQKPPTAIHGPIVGKEVDGDAFVPMVRPI